MSTLALSQAKGWASALHDAEFRGRTDTDGAARYRLSKRTGIRESYLYRLQYKAAEMKDVAGEAYRRLKVFHDELVARNNEAADRYRSERLGLRVECDDPTSEKRPSQGLGKGPSGD